MDHLQEAQNQIEFATEAASDFLSGIVGMHAAIAQSHALIAIAEQLYTIADDLTAINNNLAAMDEQRLVR